MYLTQQLATTSQYQDVPSASLNRGAEEVRKGAFKVIRKHFKVNINQYNKTF